MGYHASIIPIYDCIHKHIIENNLQRALRESKKLSREKHRKLIEHIRKFIRDSRSRYMSHLDDPERLASDVKHLRKVMHFKNSFVIDAFITALFEEFHMSPENKGGIDVSRINMLRQDILTHAKLDTCKIIGGTFHDLGTGAEVKRITLRNVVAADILRNAIVRDITAIEVTAVKSLLAGSTLTGKAIVDKKSNVQELLVNAKQIGSEYKLADIEIKNLGRGFFKSKRMLCNTRSKGAPRAYCNVSISNVDCAYILKNMNITGELTLSKLIGTRLLHKPNVNGNVIIKNTVMNRSIISGEDMSTRKSCHINGKTTVKNSRAPTVVQYVTLNGDVHLDLRRPKSVALPSTIFDDNIIGTDTSKITLIYKEHLGHRYHHDQDLQKTRNPLTIRTTSKIRNRIVPSMMNPSRPWEWEEFS